MGLRAVPYTLARWKGILCSRCELFTCEKTSSIPAGHLVTHGGMSAVMDYYRGLGPEHEETLL